MLWLVDFIKRDGWIAFRKGGGGRVCLEIYKNDPTALKLIIKEITATDIMRGWGLLFALSYIEWKPCIKRKNKRLQLWHSLVKIGWDLTVYNISLISSLILKPFSFTLNDGWVSGFAEAGGYFLLKTTYVSFLIQNIAFFFSNRSRFW